MVCINAKQPFRAKWPFHSKTTPPRASLLNNQAKIKDGGFPPRE